VFALMPPIIVGWKEVLLTVGYSSIMLLVLSYVRASSHSAHVKRLPMCNPCSPLQFISIGVHILIVGNIRKTESYCALLFMSFSFLKIIQSSIDFGKERCAAISGSICDTPRSQRKVQLDESETVVLGVRDSACSEAIIGTPHWSGVTGFLGDHPWFCSVYHSVFPALSVRGYAVESIIIVFAVFCAVSGISQGVTGAGGPPRIVAYSLLDISKGAIRGLAVVNLISCLSLLCVPSRPACTL
jgi:hypothetical protein